MSLEGGLLCAVYKVCILPLKSGGLNVVGRRVGADKSGGEQGMCPFI